MRPAWPLAACLAAGCAWLLLPGPDAAPEAPAPAPPPARPAPRPAPVEARFEPILTALPTPLPARPRQQGVLIRGRLLDERGRLPEDAELRAEVDGDTGDVFFDDDGTFVVRGPAGRYTLLARAPALAPAVVQDLVVADGEEVRGVDVTLVEGERLEGLVVAAEDGEPTGGVRVTLEGAGYFLTAYADEEGRFRFEGLPRAEFELRAFDEGLGADQARFRAGERDATLRLARRAVVRGLVLGPDGRPVPGASLAHFEADPTADRAEHDPFGDRTEGSVRLAGFGSCGPYPACLAQAEADAEGRFELPVAAGARLRLLAFDGAQVAVSAPLEPGAAEVVLTLAEPERVPVRTVDGQGQPVRAPVRFEPEDGLLGPATPRIRTAADGTGVLALWPGVPGRLIAGAGARLEFPGRRPAEGR